MPLRMAKYQLSKWAKQYLSKSKVASLKFENKKRSVVWRPIQRKQNKLNFIK